MKINVASKSPVGDTFIVTLIRTDTTLDHSQKAEKVKSQLQQCSPDFDFVLDRASGVSCETVQEDLV